MDRVDVDSAAVTRVARETMTPELEALGAEIVQRARQQVGVWSPAEGEPGWSVSRRVAARRPGTLRDSIHAEVVQTGDPGSPVVLRVGSDDDVAWVHHEGSDPHRIVPRRAPRLVFWHAKAGTTVASRAVSHPGTRPNPYLREAMDDALRAL